MEATIRLGRVAGIRIGANWSLVAIFVLLVAGLAGNALPTRSPGSAAVVYLAAAVVAALLFFASLLAHELAHALVARRAGVQVEGITLWLFGGVARLSGEARTPGSDFRIAAVGPLTSLLLGGAFALAAAGLTTFGGPPVAVATARWLAGINVVLALFNLLPGAPLDGGRILRAALWRRHGSQARATRTAARAGQVLGAVLIALGVLQFLAGASFGGLWLALIGWFLIGAARAEEQGMLVRQALAGVRVRDVMTPAPLTASGEVSVGRFLDQYVLANRFSTFPIVGPRGALEGLVTLQRLKAVPPERRDSTTVAEVACPRDELLTAAPDEPLADLLGRLVGCGDGRALVLDDGRLVGIVSPSDVARVVQLAALRHPGLAPLDLSAAAHQPTPQDAQPAERPDGGPPAS